MERVQGVENIYWKHLLVKAMNTVREKWKGREVPIHFAHGDFAPWNALQINGRLYLYDWEYAQEEMPAGYDLFHFMVQVLMLVKDYTLTEIIVAVTQWNRDSDLAIYWNRIGIEKRQFHDLFRLYCINKTLEVLHTCCGNQCEGDRYARTLSLMSIL